MFLSLKKKKENDAFGSVKSSPKKGNFLLLLQELGKALQFPIAVLPFAAILNRFGNLGITFTTDADGNITNQVGYWISFIIQKPGGVAFDNLPLLFALGLAFGLSKDHRGEVTLVAAVFYFIIAVMNAEHGLPEMMYKNVLTFQDKDGHAFSQLFYVKEFAKGSQDIVVGGKYVLNVGVLGGVTAGCFSAYLYNRLSHIQLPQALSFFSGRRFVPMVGILVAIPVAFAFAVLWPWIQYVLMMFGQAVANPDNPAITVPGTAVYAVLNRFLLPFGLHQILNTFFWFQLPIGGHVVDPITGAIGTETIWANGDISAFTKGIQGSGFFQGGFFPIMMGGIPAIAIAMIFAAKKENRAKMGGFFGGVALVSLISGITEPIEFSFVFVSPLLLVIHALLTGIFVATSTGMGIQVGFGFSAGLIDYIVSFAQSWGFAASKSGVLGVTSNPLWTLALTAVAGGVYYVVFYSLIKKLDIQTPGREHQVDPNLVAQEPIGIPQPIKAQKQTKV
ncbi:PTS transporter subunit EIIC [Williamsoniiplasma lucivorax]|uniref:PTS system, N-acetylglucosamine-specific IIBC component n=1 Tax=Williamsoniiplasma lucivorax TaxID=209274 RepID=A0A2S5RF46_9MOLU|nr:PTS transporter subunit EIIC [Williamsoniiplasma lucivorax]PPE05755.1 PTS system, N-acetylglucosamine-specific IIBC component [Williamsoniiplasma lucivorax]